MYQNPTPWARTVCETQQPLTESLSSPPIHSSVLTLTAGDGGWDTSRLDPPCNGVRAEGAVATARLQSAAKPSVRPVLPLLVFFILLFVGTLGAEPLYLFWGCSRNPNARPAKDRKISYHLSGVTLLLFLTQRNETFQREIGSGLQINIAIILSLS